MKVGLLLGLWTTRYMLDAKRLSLKHSYTAV